MNHPTPPPISEVRISAAAKPLALVVGLPDSAAMACARRLMLAGFAVARAATGPSACERAAVLKPELIVVSRELWSCERQAVEESASLLGSVVVESPFDGALDIARIRLAS